MSGLKPLIIHKGYWDAAGSSESLDLDPEQNPRRCFLGILSKTSSLSCRGVTWLNRVLSLLLFFVLPRNFGEVTSPQAELHFFYSAMFVEAVWWYLKSVRFEENLTDAVQIFRSWY